MVHTEVINLKNTKIIIGINTNILLLTTDLYLAVTVLAGLFCTLEYGFPTATGTAWSMECNRTI